MAGRWVRTGTRLDGVWRWVIRPETVSKTVLSHAVTGPICQGNNMDIEHPCLLFAQFVIFFRTGLAALGPVTVREDMVEGLDVMMFW